MSIASGTFIFQCNDCHAQTTYLPEDSAFGSEVFDPDRQMGPEYRHHWNENFECSCGNEITLTYNVYEYPVGAFNIEQIDLEGATEIQTFDYDFHDKEAPNPRPEDFD